MRWGRRAFCGAIYLHELFTDLSFSLQSIHRGQEVPRLITLEVAMVKTIRRYARYAVSTLSAAMFTHGT
jgi:hypothetical protein